MDTETPTQKDHDKLEKEFEDVLLTKANELLRPHIGIPLRNEEARLAVPAASAYLMGRAAVKQLELLRDMHALQKRMERDSRRMKQLTWAVVFLAAVAVIVPVVHLWVLLSHGGAQ